MRQMLQEELLIVAQVRSYRLKIWQNIRMQTPELRSQRRKEVVEAVILRNAPATLVARVHNITNRTIFSWLAHYRSGGRDSLKDA
jgi:hypothetical protein